MVAVRCCVTGVGIRFVVVVFLAMHLPNGGQVGYNQLIEHRVGRFQRAYNAVRVGGMGLATRIATVVAYKAVAGLQGGGFCNGAAQQGLHGLAEQLPGLQLPAILVQVGGIGTQYFEVFIAVAKGQGYQLLYKRIAAQFFHLGQWYIARGGIYLVHGAEYQLQRTAFGAHHHVNVFEVGVKLVLHLGLHQQQGADDAHAQHQQYHAQQGG